VKKDDELEESSADVRLYVESLRKNKVETLRQMVVDLGTMNDDDVKRIKKPALIEILVEARKST
jgi:hypothetical protein